MKNIELLSKICSVPGAPGHEKKIRDFIIGEIKKEGLGYTLDNLGNLIVKIKGKKEKSIMVAAHMDEIGFIVKHIDCLLYTSPSPRDGCRSRMPSSA